MNRIVFDLILFLSFFVFPWYISGVLLFLGVFIFKDFYEFVIAGIVYYSLYASHDLQGFFNERFWFYLILIGIYFLIQFIKEYIILYKDELSY